MVKKLSHMDIFEFQEAFPDDISCIDYLSKLKWPDKYECRYCRHEKYCDTKTYGERRCTRCRKPESVTAHTLFHKVKFPLVKAFYIVYFVSTSKKGISAAELSRKLDLREKTCWSFKRKVMKAMASSENHPIDGKVEVDEIFIGGQEVGKRGRSKSKKDQVVIAIQRHGKKGISRAYAMKINNAGTKELKPFFNKYISKEAKVTTDKWRGYTPLAKEYEIEQIPSKNGANFKVLHRFIMGLKSWLRGIHHSVRDIQDYLIEYTYRFNRHFMNGKIFDTLMERMMNHNPVKICELSIAT